MVSFNIKAIISSAAIVSAIRTAKKDEVSDLSSRMTAVEDTVSGLTRELSELKKMVSNSPTHLPGRIRSAGDTCVYTDGSSFILQFAMTSNKMIREVLSIDGPSYITEGLSFVLVEDPPFPEDEKLLSDMFFSWEKSTVYISGSSQFMNKEVRLQGASAVEDYSLLKHLSEEAKDMVKRTDPKKPDDCRRLFMLIDRTPPEGYERGIRWLESYVAQRAKEHPKYSK